jgi:hypothetical protein
VISNSKTDCSELSAMQRARLLLNESFPLPSKLDHIEFLVVKSGLFDDHIMPELLEKHRQDHPTNLGEYYART